MSAANASTMPVGVRAVTGPRAGRLTWVSVGAVEAADLPRGRRVLVQDGEGDWLAEVVVPPGELLESPQMKELPMIARLATGADIWPTMPDRAGRSLLDSLGLPPDLLVPPGT